MNKRAGIALTVLLLAGCEAKSDEPEIVVFFEDYQDWKDWKKEQDAQAEIEAFKPSPIFVTGIGRSRGKPDIAVLSGAIKTKAEYDYAAVDEAGLIINKVQEAARGADIDFSFTQVATAEIRDPECLSHNRYAWHRHNDIIADNNFNMWLKQQPKENRQQPRKPKPRIAQKTCPVTHIEGYVSFTAWVNPVDKAGDYINAFTAAGVDKVTLFGYDFSNYDALYREAAEQAVLNAKAKAVMSAKTAGTKLTTLEQFWVGPTQRTTRYGQQAMIISNHGNRYVAQRKYHDTQSNVITARGNGYAAETDEIVVTATKRSAGYTDTTPMAVMAPPTPMIMPEAGLLGASQFNEPNMADVTNIPQNNALRMTMLSGGQTITVRAGLSFSYETPLNGKVIIQDDE